MKRLIMLAALVIFSTFSYSHDHKGADGEASMADALTVKGAWARETFKLAKSGAAYGTFKNDGSKDITIASAKIDATVASMVELHTTKMVDNVMRMQELEDGIVVPAGEEVSFSQGGNHFMIMGLTGPLVSGENFNITLIFADASEKTIEFDVQDMRSAVN
ncbi:copper chaperone PCu(A)C [Ningiella sp. W23]|uniref:copper chaperone PCu(A)C n=1 Tax=Ningiella sp. W23 TaxID=3023715 RepID=UPI00375675F3